MTKKIAVLAETYNASMAPHLYAGPLEWAANIHFGASIPNLLIVESIKTGEGFQRDLITKEILWEDGFIKPPEGPGLGIELNEEAIEEHLAKSSEGVHGINDKFSIYPEGLFEKTDEWNDLDSHDRTWS